VAGRGRTAALNGGPRKVREVLERHGLRPSRALGQNFVADRNTVRRVAALSGVGPGRPVLEIGPGLGALTRALAETGARVVAVEADARLLPALQEQVGGLGVEVVHGDAMTIDLGALLGSGTSWSVVANLPYNVAVPVVVRLLEEAPAVSDLTVMVQREVGERLAASPGSRDYGVVSVKVAYYATARVVGRVPATVFVPRPRVESALVRIDRRDRVAVDPAVVGPERLFAVVRAGFGQRRKMLRGALAGVVGPACFAEAGIDPRARAEELSVEDWGRLAACSG
jgi:16S rRNA (adenine1518-N6/adenine1519-N6)-dimethyltransferase